MVAPRNNAVPVYDPEHETLKAVPADQAKHFADMGYDVGDNAKNRMLQASPLAKVGSFLTSFGNSGSAGLLNLGLAGLGQKTALKNEARAQEANSASALAGNVAGIVGGTIVAPLALGGKAAIGGAYALGGLGKGTLAAAAERGGLANILAKGTNAALQGAPAVALQSASDTVTENAILNHPTTVQQLGASALSDLVWNAGLIGATHGIIKAPSLIRQGAGKTLDQLERLGALKAKYKKVAQAVGETGPRVTSTTETFEREYAAQHPTEANLDLLDNSDDVGQIAKAASPATDPAAKAGEAALGRIEHDIAPKAGLPDEALDNIMAAKGRISTPLEPVPDVEGLSVKRARLKAEQASSAAAEKIAAIEPEDLDFHFEYEPGTTKGQKKDITRAMIKERLQASGDENAMHYWDEALRLENTAKELTTQHKIDLAKGGAGISDHDNKISRIWAEKKMYTDELRDLVPREIDKETGIVRPGFDDLLTHYGEVVTGRTASKNLPRPDFVANAPKHAALLAKAEKAEANLALLESHQKELQNRAQVIERNKLAKAAEKAEAKAAADKAKTETAAAAREAKEARAAEQSAKAAPKAEMPKAGSQAPKSARTQQFTAETNTAEGLRRDTLTRKEANGRVKERHRVVIKAPKLPPDMVFDGYHMPFDNGVATAATLAGFIPGVGLLGHLAAGGMAAANGFTKAASSRVAIGKAWESIAGKIAKGMAAPILPGHRIYKASTRGTRSEAVQQALKPDEYQRLAKSVAQLHTNPTAVQGYMDKKYPGVKEEYPETHQSIAVAMMKALAALHASMPKKPYDPTLMDVDFVPTRAQQVGTLRAFTLLSNPTLGLDYASPKTMQMLNQAYPDLVAHHREQLIRQVQDSAGSMSGRTARQVSSYLGANVRPLDDAATLKRLQETAGPAPMQPPKGGGGGTGGGSSKITNQAVQRDMPSDGLNQLGS